MDESTGNLIGHVLVDQFQSDARILFDFGLHVLELPHFEKHFVLWLELPLEVLAADALLQLGVLGLLELQKGHHVPALVQSGVLVDRLLLGLIPKRVRC